MVHMTSLNFLASIRNNVGTIFPHNVGVQSKFQMSEIDFEIYCSIIIDWYSLIRQPNISL